MTENISFRRLWIRSKRHFSGQTILKPGLGGIADTYLRKNRTFIAVLTAVLIGFTGCSRNDTFRYDTPDEALVDYALFLKKVGGKKRVSTADLISLTMEWHTTGDSVRRCIARNATDAETDYSIRFAALNDSITVCMENMVDSRPRNYTDYLSVLSALNDVEKDAVSDSLIASVHRFYDKAGTAPVFAGNDRAVIRRYERILDDAIDKGFNSKQDVFRFLHDEDVAFRSFLNHLPTLGSFSLESISSKSKILTTRMFNLAAGHSPMFTKAEIVLILTIRQNRRVIQNSHKCLEDIRTLKLTDANQQTAYLWMILQPWIIIDDFSYFLLDKEQLELLESIAAETGKAPKKLPGSRFPIDVETLPSTLIKTRISYPDK